MDFFTVPTLTFGVLYCFFVIGHDRRKILHFNVTRNPNALWVVQQLREAWAYKESHRFLLFDRDAKFGADVVSAVRDMESQPTRTAFRSPWQNGVAERWVGSCRRDLLNHVIILNERHLKTAHVCVPALLSRGPDSSWTREGHASRSAYGNPLCA
jgi:transposase InsO family protein